MTSQWFVIIAESLKSEGHERFDRTRTLSPNPVFSLENKEREPLRGIQIECELDSE